MHDSIVPSPPLNLKLAVHPIFLLMQLCRAGRVYLRQHQGSLSGLQGFAIAALAMWGFTLSYQTFEQIAGEIRASQPSSPVSQFVSYEPPNWGHPAQTTGSATR